MGKQSEECCDERPLAVKAICCVMKLLFTPHGLLLLLLGYTFFGAAVFRHLEKKAELVNNREVIKHENQIRFKFAQGLHNASNLNLKPEHFMKYVFKELRKYEEVMSEVSADKTEMWQDFVDALFYCGTVYTTIGYGNVYPKTDGGKIFTIFYSLVGIPLCLMVLSEIGKCLTEKLKQLFRAVNSSLTDETFPIDNNYDFMLPVSLAIVVGYTVIATFVFQAMEDDWDFVDAFYFIFITTSTIGFGDLTPDDELKFIGAFLLTFIGLSLVAMMLSSLQLTMEDVVVMIRNSLEGGSSSAGATVAKQYERPSEADCAKIYGRQFNETWAKESEEAARLREQLAMSSTKKTGGDKKAKKSADPTIGNPLNDEAAMAMVYERPQNSWQNKQSTTPAAAEKPKPAAVKIPEASAKPMSTIPAPPSPTGKPPSPKPSPQPGRLSANMGGSDAGPNPFIKNASPTSSRTSLASQPSSMESDGPPMVRKKPARGTYL